MSRPVKLLYGLRVCVDPAARCRAGYRADVWDSAGRQILTTPIRASEALVIADLGQLAPGALLAGPEDYQ